MTTYWLSDTCALLKSFNIIPFGNEDINEDYNSLTRLIILVTVVLAFIRPEEYVNILLTGVVSICITIMFYFMNFNIMNKDEKRQVNPKTEKPPELDIGNVSGEQLNDSIQRFNDDNLSAFKKEGLASNVDFTELFKFKK